MVWAAAALFFTLHTATSCGRWANFGYETFDLAYYVQGLWQLLHARLEVSVEHVPLLGNHVEPIVFLIAPLFAAFRHPMTFVVVQNAGLAAMGPIAYDIARRLDFGRTPALLLGAAILITPATGFVALHEFHPEALTAPLLLLMLRARLTKSLRAHWLWFIAAMACKENVALLLAAYCGVHILIERRRPMNELIQWYLWPLLTCIAWLLLCVKVITPSLNAGSIDYFTLYDRLGSSPTEVVINGLREPQRILTALTESLRTGNLLPALLLPFLGLPLVRPRWLVISAPIVFQHLLSWRSSEWMIYFHYAAPLIPLFWMGLAEGLRTVQRFRTIQLLAPGAMATMALVACLAAQVAIGPIANIVRAAAAWSASKFEREKKARFIAAIPPDASVAAPLPYLSHLALREELYSLHYVLKGLKTLSRARYVPPPPPQFVLIDYGDPATFSRTAGFYHPAMKTVDGSIIPSSERLLHEFLRTATWTARSDDELVLLERVAVQPPAAEVTPDRAVFQIGEHTELQRISKSSDSVPAGGSVEIELRWLFRAEREVIPWMYLRAVAKQSGAATMIAKGLCAPEVASGAHVERWRVSALSRLSPGEYSIEAWFVDNSSRSSMLASDPTSPPSASTLANPIPLGEFTVLGAAGSADQ